MKFLDTIYRFLLRFRYPLSLPQDIAEDLGLPIARFYSFDDFLTQLTCPSCRPSRLVKFMPREEAEQIFQGAINKERFRKNSSFCYSFNQGTIEFILQFDECDRLRRLYVQHKHIADDRGLEISLPL